MNARKLAIILSGGGMRCAYGAGVLVTLAKEYGVTAPLIIIGSSGSAGTGAYFVAGQYDSIRRIWTEHICTPRFVDIWRIRTILDIDYLIDNVFTHTEPLDVGAVARANTTLAIPMLDLHSGTVAYFSNKDGGDMLEYLRAAKAMPIAYKMNPGVLIHGRHYCDSPLTTRGATHQKYAVDAGATDILVIENSPTPRSRVLDSIFSLWLRLYSAPQTYAASRNAALAYAPPASVRVLRFTPRTHIPYSRFTNDPAHTTALFTAGCSDARNDAALRAFICSSPA